MNLNQFFRLLIMLSWCFGLSSVIVSEITSKKLPPELQKFRTSVENRKWAPLEEINALITIPMFGAYVAASVGLLRFSYWARPLYIVSYLFFLVLPLSEPPFVETQIAGVLGELETLIDGCIIGLAYFSPVAKEFQLRV